LIITAHEYKIYRPFGHNNLEPIAPKSKAVIGSPSFWALACSALAMQSAVTAPTVLVLCHLRPCACPGRGVSLCRCGPT
jgi:hypothetical protein